MNNTTYSFENDLAQRFNQIVIKKETGRLIKILQEIEPSLLDLRLGENSVIFCDVGAPELLPIYSLGDGIMRLLAVVLCISSAPNGTIVIDEIDTGFHYSSLKTMWKAVLESARQYNTQIFATTHSEDCVKSFSNIELGELFKSKDVAMYRIEKSNGTLNSVNYDLETLRASIESDWETR